MNLERNFANNRFLEKKRPDNTLDDESDILVADDDLDLENEKTAIKNHDDLELAKIRDSLKSEYGGQNKTLNKIMLGLGLATVVSGKVEADVKKDSDKLADKIEYYTPRDSNMSQVDDTTFVVGNKLEVETELEDPEEIEEAAREKLVQAEEAKFILSKEDAQVAYNYGTFDKIINSDQAKLLLCNIYKIDSVDYIMAENISKAIEMEPATFIKEAHNFLNLEHIDIGGRLEDAVVGGGDEIVEAFLKNYKNLEGVPGFNAAKMLDEVIDKDAWIFLSHGYKLGDQVSSEKMTDCINKACAQSSYQFFSHLNKYAKIPGLDIVKLVKDNAADYPNGILYSAPILQKFMPEPELIRLMEATAPNVEPASFLLAFSECENIKGIAASTRLNKVLLDAAWAVPGNFINKDLPTFRKMSSIADADIVKVAEKLKAESPTYFLEQISFLKGVQGIDLAKLTDELYNKNKDTKANFLANAKDLTDVKNLDLAAKIKEVAPSNRGLFLREAVGFKNIEGLDLGPMITEFAQTNGADFLSVAKDYQDIPNLDLVKLVNDIAPTASSHFLQEVGGLKNIPGLDVAKLIKDLAPLDGLTFVYNVDSYKDIPGLDLIPLINDIAPRQGKEFLQEINKFKNIPGLDLGALVNAVVPDQADMFFENIHNFRDIPGVKFDIIVNNLYQKNPRFFLENIDDFTNLVDFKAEEVLTKLIDTKPDLVIANSGCLKYIKNEQIRFAMIEKLFSIYPEGALVNRKLLNVVENPTSEVVKVLKGIKDMDSFLLLDDMVKNDMPEEEALAIVGDQAKLLPKLLDIKARPDHLAKFAIDKKLESVYLEVVLDINYRHNLPDEPRFKSISSFSARELYTTMVYGEDEIYTSSFNGCFNRLVGGKGLVGKMKTEKINGRDLLDQVGNNKFRTFVKECTWFNRLEEFLVQMDKKDSDELLRNVVRNIETNGDKLDNALTLAEIFGGAKDAGTLQLLQEQVKLEVERLDKDEKASPEDKIMYNLLSGMFGDNAVVDKEWFAQKAKEYPMGKVIRLENKELFNKDGVCAQKYHFYEGGDRDGINSFNNFIEGYKADSVNWKIDDSNPNYVIITGEKAGRKIEIYANNPNFGNRGTEGLREIEELMAGRELTATLYSYRGHSTNVRLDGVSNKTKIINLGSCGGFNRVNEILDLSPESHVISTKGTGTKYVNDPIFKDLNDKILAGEDIDWRQFWDRQAKKLSSNEHFSSYVPPHKNQGMMYMKAYRDLSRKLLGESLSVEDEEAEAN